MRKLLNFIVLASTMLTLLVVIPTFTYAAQDLPKAPTQRVVNYLQFQYRVVTGIDMPPAKVREIYKRNYKTINENYKYMIEHIKYNYDESGAKNIMTWKNYLENNYLYILDAIYSGWMGQSF